jgi:hypothetical protein
VVLRTFSPARARRPAVVARLARTLGIFECASRPKFWLLLPRRSSLRLCCCSFAQERHEIGAVNGQSLAGRPTCGSFAQAVKGSSTTQGERLARGRRARAASTATPVTRNGEGHIQRSWLRATRPNPQARAPAVREGKSVHPTVARSRRLEEIFSRLVLAPAAGASARQSSLSQCQSLLHSWWRNMPNHSVKPTCLRHAAYLKR